MQIETEERESVFADDEEDAQPLMTDAEFDEELALAAEGRFGEIGLFDGKDLPGFEKVPLSEFEKG